MGSWCINCNINCINCINCNIFSKLSTCRVSFPQYLVVRVKKALSQWLHCSRPYDHMAGWVTWPPVAAKHCLHPALLALDVCFGVRVFVCENVCSCPYVCVRQFCHINSIDQLVPCTKITGKWLLRNVQKYHLNNEILKNFHCADAP